KVAGRLKAGQKASFPVSSGRHIVSALDDPGDLWEQTIEVGPELFETVISFEKIRADRLALTNEVTSLRTGNTEQQQRLSRIQSQNDNLQNNANRIREERRLIVEAINHYADHYGKELGLHESDKTAGMQLVNAASQPTTSDPNNMSNAEATAKMAEWGFALLFFLRAHHHNVFAHRVGDRMAELEESLKDPLKHPRGPDQASYLVAVRSVVNKKIPGQLITAPNRI